MIFTRLGKKEILANNRGGTIHDAVQDQPYISVPKNSEFQSGPRVVKMVFNKSISMAINVISYKKSKEMLKRTKPLILLCKFGPQAQK